MIQIQWSKHQNCFPYALEWAFSKYRNFRIIICRQRYVHWTEFGFRIQLFQNCQKNNITLSSSINFVWNRNPIWGKSCWPIRVFILDLVNMRRILNINSFNKKFIAALVEGFNRLVLFNFMYFFTSKWVANFEITFIAYMIKFFIMNICLRDVNYCKMYTSL